MTLAKEIRNALKEAGYNARQVSVRQHRYEYDRGVDITIKSAGIAKKTIEEIVKGFRKVQYCEMTHEVLLGGNVFIDIDFDYDLEAAALEAATSVAESLDLGAHDVFGGLATVYVNGLNAYEPFAVWVGDRHRYTAHDEHALVRALAQILLDEGVELAVTA